MHSLRMCCKILCQNLVVHPKCTPDVTTSGGDRMECAHKMSAPVGGTEWNVSSTEWNVGRTERNVHPLVYKCTTMGISDTISSDPTCSPLDPIINNGLAAICHYYMYSSQFILEINLTSFLSLENIFGV